jgi:hypothetical protein
MTVNVVALDDLLEARESLIDSISGRMPDDHKRFLLGFKRGNPDWALLGAPKQRFSDWPTEGLLFPG